MRLLSTNEQGLSIIDDPESTRFLLRAEKLINIFGWNCSLCPAALLMWINQGQWLGKTYSVCVSVYARPLYDQSPRLTAKKATVNMLNLS